MPTMTIASDLADPSARSRFVKRLVPRLGRLGVEVGHVLTVWRTLEACDVFTGVAPLGAPEARGPFALVGLEIDRARDSAWRETAIAAVREAARGILDDKLLFVRLVPVDPADHWNAAIDARRNAAPEPPTPDRSVEEQP